MVPDHLLLQLLVTWLSPSAAMQQPKAQPAARPEDSPQGCCRTKPADSDCRQKQSTERPPLQARRKLGLPRNPAALCAVGHLGQDLELLPKTLAE